MDREEIVERIKWHIHKVDELARKLEQEPCEDAISRSETIKYLNTNMAWYNEDGEMADSDERLKAITNLINGVPSVAPVREKDKWIPCSERMPKQNEYVDHVCKYYLIQDEYGDMYIAHYTNIGWILIDSLCAMETKVVAWMPLPEEYKTETEGEE